MNGFASCTIVGNLTRDPALKYAPSGTPICEFGLAVNTKYTKDGQKVEEVSYFDITCFGKTAEVAGQYLLKGKPLAIEGRLEQQRWETQDGQKRSKIAVIASRIHFLPDGKQGQGGEEGEQQSG